MYRGEGFGGSDYSSRELSETSRFASMFQGLLDAGPAVGAMVRLQRLHIVDLAGVLIRISSDGQVALLDALHVLPSD